MSMRYAPWLAFGFSVALLVALLAAWPGPSADDQQTPPPTGEPREVVVWTAAALRHALEPAAAEFKHDTQIDIELRFGASEDLLSKLKVTRQGDLFLPADDSYVVQARDLGLVEQDYDLATMTGVAVFRANFPKDVKDLTWDDVFRPGFRLAQPNPATAIGKITRDALEPTGLWARIEAARYTSVGTVTEAANAVKIGSADGAIIWDAVARAYPVLKVAKLPQLERIRARVTVAVCNNAAARTHARWFAQYLAEPNAGQKHFVAAGYMPPTKTDPPRARGARPGEDAQIVLYAGAMLQPAIEATIKEFQERENVKVTRVYNGCGILVSQMRGGKMPDLYFACDPRFMGDVADRFCKPEVVSSNQLVIAVAKGNPHQLKELKDLGKEGLRVGVGHEQQCALGAITRQTFIQSGVYAAVRKNVKVESPTGDLLVNQLMTGSLDAVVCYVSNVTPNLARLDAIPVTGIPCAAPEQPIAIAKGSTNPELAAKLIEYIRSQDSRRRFEELGFGWGPRGPKK